MKKLVAAGMSLIALSSIEVSGLDALLIRSNRYVMSGQSSLFQQMGKYAPGIQRTMQSWGVKHAMTRNPYVQMMGVGIATAACCYAWSHYAYNQGAQNHDKDEKLQESDNSFAALARRGDDFYTHVQIRLEVNNISSVGANDPQKQQRIVEHALGTYYLADRRVIESLIPKFLSWKQVNGSLTEKRVYDNMTPWQFIERLKMKRPVVFFCDYDKYTLRNGAVGSGGFEKIGTEQEFAWPILKKYLPAWLIPRFLIPENHLSLKNYLSYDEIQISALLGISGYTHFTNNGNRDNVRAPGEEGSFEPEGVYIGQVGARFERRGLMEQQHIIITEEQNTAENGYGLSNQNPQKLGMWEELYGMKFPTYQEACGQYDQNNDAHRYLQIGVANAAGKVMPGYFDTLAYKKRMRLIVEPFLCEANKRGKDAGKRVYLHVPGWGAGAWALFKDAQHQLTVDVVAEVLQERQFTHIVDINFSWFGDNIKKCGDVSHGEQYTSCGNNICIHFSKRNPAEKLEGNDAGKLLVAGYAWDGNSLAAGNEYWQECLNNSGDPAAASCSTIGELQNPEVNVHLQRKPVVLYPAQGAADAE